jgi:hydrogenase maturation protease
VTIKALVVGFGNPLRGDDGLGQIAAAMLAAAPPDGAEVRACHQLTPELAERLAGVDLAVFIDAAAGAVAGSIAVEPVEPAAARIGLDHHVDAGMLLTLAERLYGRAPAAFLVRVGAASFTLGAELSEPVRAALPAVLATVARLVRARLIAGAIRKK